MRGFYYDTYTETSLTFETFKKTVGNTLAYTAATDYPVYSPLIIYGKRSSEKTHLLHAIGNQFLQNYPTAKVLSISAEQLDSLTFDTVDCLLIDNFQLLTQNPDCPKTFAHKIKNTNEPIVIASNDLHMDFYDLEPYFSCHNHGISNGLLVDIQD